MFLACLKSLTFFLHESFDLCEMACKIPSLIKLPGTPTHRCIQISKINGLESSELETLSSSSTDLTSEQTINTDASSLSFGITSMTNSISATQSWAESHFFKTTIIWSLLDMLDQIKTMMCRSIFDMELLPPQRAQASEEASWLSHM